MEKIKRLNRFQKGILLFMDVMALVFSILYPVTISRKGFAYQDTILVPSQENHTTVYSGRLQGQPAQFTVSEDKTVVFQYGGKTYGPYRAKEDPTAIPKNSETAEYMTGLELRRGTALLFRGGILDLGDSLLLYNADGTLFGPAVSYVTGAGIEVDENGNPVDSMEPSVYAILRLMNVPTLTHKGQWFAWFGAMFLCALNALCILFADELFRLNLAFRIRGADHAEPSDWEIAGRYISWTFLSVAALAIFIMGLCLIA